MMNWISTKQVISNRIYLQRGSTFGKPKKIVINVVRIRGHWHH